MMFTMILGVVASAAVAAPAAPHNVSTCSEELKKYCGDSRTTHETCIDCTAAHESDLDKVHCSYYDIERFCGEIPPPPPLPGKNCSASEYCCPDAVHCLTPISETSCDPKAGTKARGVAGPNEECETGEICCPLTEMCVKVGKACKPPPVCGKDAFCCPDAKRCLTPVKATGMKFCEPKDKDACKSHGAGAICCPLIGQCVTVGAACTTTTAPEFMEEL